MTERVAAGKGSGRGMEPGRARRRISRRMLWKNIFRTLGASKGRFISIACLVALGSFALVGLQATGPDMRSSLAAYTTSFGFTDLYVMGDLGLDEDDVAQIEALEGVQTVEFGYLVDVEIAGSTDSVRVQSVPQELSCYELVSGRMPEAADEIALGSSLAGAYELGSTIEVVEADADDDSAVLTTHSFTVVGFVNSSEILGSSTMGSSTVGTGTLTAYAVVAAEAFDVEYYMVARLSFCDTATLDPTSQEYLDLVAAHKEEVEEALAGAGERRYATVCAEYEDAIAEGEEDIADAEAELAEAAAELDDAAAELAEAEQELADAEQELVEAAAELADGAAEISDAEAEIAEAEEQIAAAEEELAAGEAELAANKETLDEAARVLAASQVELEDSAEQIAAAKTEIAENEAALAEAQEQVDAYYAALAEYEAAAAEADAAETTLAEAASELDAQAEAVAAAEEEIAAGESALSAARAELEAAQAAYEENLAAYEEAAAAYAAGLLGEDGAQVIADFEVALAEAAAQIEAGAAQIAASEAALAEVQEQVNAYYAALAAYEAGAAELAENQAQLAAAKEELDAQAEAVAAAEEEIAAGEAALAAAEEELAQAQAAYDAGLAEYEAGVTAYEEGCAAYDEAVATLASATSALSASKQELDQARTALTEAQAEYEEGQAEYADGQSEYEDGCAEYADGLAAYEDGCAEYEEAATEAELEIADAREELEDAREQLAELEVAQVSIMNHREFYGSNGYTTYVAIYEMVDSVAAIFPTFFYLVAALVISSTMTRMVDEERACAGTLKALGYTDADVLKKFLFYGAAAASIGAVVGIVTGHLLLPYLIYQAFASYFTLPALTLSFYPLVTVAAAGLAFAVALVPTAIAAKATAAEKPAALMSPKAPAAGSKILLERIAPIWRRLSFTYKVTARNLFRYKVRALMTILGVLGSVGLIFFGFAVTNSIGGISARQFEEILGYDLIVAVDEDATQEELAEVEALLQDDDITGSSFVAYESASCVAGSKNDTQNIYLFSAASIDELAGYINVFDNDTGALLELPAHGAIISKRLSTLAEVDVGDTIVIEDADGVEREVEVAGVCEMYIEHFLFMSDAAYEELFGSEPEDNAYLVDVVPELAEDTGDIAAGFIAAEAVTGVVQNSDSLVLLDTFVVSMNIIMVILIVVSIMLACVIVYNLVTINVAERIRELSTIKVLGFFNDEVTMYIYRETIALSCLAVPMGWVFGWLLQQYLINAVPPDRVMFDPSPGATPFIVSTTVLAAVVGLMGLVVYRQLKRVDMLEALKSVD